MYNRRYDKKFFMLRQEQTGFSGEQKTAWGSSILEIKNSKGCLTTKVQGLKSLSNTPYHIYLIGKNEEVIFCDEIQLNKDGQGDLIWEFSPDFMHTTNTHKSITIEEIGGILIVVNKNGEYFAPLVAYINETINWKTFFKPISKEFLNTNVKHLKEIDVRQSEVKPEIIPETKHKLNINSEIKDADGVNLEENADICVAENPTVTKPKIFNFNFNSSVNEKENKKELIEKDTYSEERYKKIQKYENTENSDNTENCHGNFSALIKKFRKELKELTEEGVFTKKDLEKIHNAGKIGNDTNDYTDFEPKTETQTKTNPIEYIEKRIQKRYNRIETFFKDSKQVAPFADKKDMWHCITLDEMVLIPSFPIEWQKKFFFLYPMKHYNHFLYKEINGTNYIAVPSHKKYIDDDRKEASELGFSDFISIDNSDFGYWICKKD